MKLISDDYRAQNAQLHRENQKYGSGSHRRAGIIADFIEPGDVVLDYGCGKGSLKGMLSCDVREYDPAIPGKDGMPDPADVVVCTDVMEHIEPEFLDKVVSHIYSLTRKKLYMTIALRPASKSLPDGRNTHLIVEGKEFWREKLSKYFVFDDFHISAADSGELVVVASPIRELKEIPAKGAIDDDVRGQQMASCLARGLPRVQLGKATGEAALICYGPSLHDTIEDIRALQDRGVHIVTCSGAHDFLLERGIVPHAHVDIDGREHKAGLIKDPVKSVQYWMASVCHPAYFDKLAGFDVSIFHIQNTEATVDWVRENDPQSWLLTGGLTVGNRAMGLLHHMGYSRIHVFGMDCSYGPQGRHAGPHTGKVQQKMQIRAGDRWFFSSPQMICAARNMVESLEHIQRVSDVTFYGDGLLQWMIRIASGEVKTQANAA